MAEWLLELFSEEIPARMQAGAARDLERMAREGLERAGLDVGAVRTFAGPRRLTLVVDGLPVAQPDRVEERKGPRVTAPEAALAGFLRSTGLTRDQLVERDGVFIASIATVGRATAEIIAELVPDLVRRFPWPKSMTWGSGSLRWVRPLHRILCVFDSEVVTFGIDGIVSGDQSEGHRVMARGRAFSARTFADYSQSLTDAFVMLDAGERARRIAADANTIAEARGLTLVDDPGLLTEVAGMVEWPVVLLGDMDERFLQLPPEVIRTTMRTHQRYFALRAPDGELAPHFIAIANLETPDHGALIAKGNARVLAARLEDARFFWDEDRKLSVRDRINRLNNVVYHDKLGTLYSRTKRLQALAAEIGPYVGVDSNIAGGIALAMKLDLTSQMVGEFPELQGIMGGYYAEADGWDKRIVDAISEQYRPAGPLDFVPTKPLSVVMSLCDKIDILTSFFAIGEVPTSSRDPFGLRRAALATIRLIVSSGIRLSLKTILGRPYVRSQISSIDVELDRSQDFALRYIKPETFATLNKLKSDVTEFKKSVDEKIDEVDSEDWDRHGLLKFIIDRFRVVAREQGYPPGVVEAVLASGDDDLVRIFMRLDSIENFLATSDGANLLAGCKRAINILAAEAKKGTLPTAAPRRTGPPAEVALFDALEALGPRLDADLAAENFAAAMAALASLRAPVDQFFEDVMVNSDDPAERDNRLALLMRVRTSMARVADFALIQG